MARFWNRWKNNRWGENKGADYSWQYNDEEPDYGWLKRTLVAIIIFAVVYCVHISETTIGRVLDDGMHYMLSTQTDFNYVIEQIVSKVPSNIDLSVLKKAQTTVSKPADPLLYMNKPVAGKIVAPFGWWVHPVLKQEMMHEGINIEATLGTNIKAAAAGKVKMITENAQYGKMLIVEHSQDIDTVYGHLGEILVSQGDIISQGQVIGKVGKTGMVSGPSLYFEVREKGTAIDPVTRLKGDSSAIEGK